MGALRASLLGLLCLLASSTAMGQQKVSVEDYAEDQMGRIFRFGIEGFGIVTGKDPNMDSLLGAGIALPLTASIYRGLGVRVGFYGQYQKFPEMGFRWRAPDPSFDDGDEVWEPGEQPLPLTDGSMVEIRRKAQVALYALTTSFNYELTSPYSRVLQVFQPFVGIGPIFTWLYTYSDIQAEEVYLIDNEMNDIYDENNIDPFSVQFLVGLDVYGGFHFNLGRTFRITIELGYLRAEVPEFELRKATDGFEGRHLDYTLSMFRWGGGFLWRM